MITVCLGLVLVGLAISWPMTWLLVRAGHQLGVVDEPEDRAAGGRKWHARAVPNLGGVAIFWGVMLPVLLGLAAAWAVPPQDWTGPAAALVDHLPGVRRQTPLILAVVLAAGVLHVLGLVDDRKRLGPLLKLIVQLAVAGVLVGAFGLRVFELLDTYFGAAGAIASGILTVLWIVVITNAMNMLDNMDGLSAGVGAIIAALYLAANLLGGQWFVAAMAALLLGALIGFLAFNFPPASIFMGDGGSLVLGLLLAIISIRTTYVGVPTPDAVVGPSRAYGVLMPLVVMAIPLYDFVSVVIIRTLTGKSPFVGDRNHFSHRLVRKGLTEKRAVIVIWLCTLATGLGGVMLGRLEAWQAALVAGQCAAVLAVLALMERGGNTDEHG
ncbi:MAG: MraY family glycosyltransferase [Phycisphaeraceae bacterium]